MERISGANPYRGTYGLSARPYEAADRAVKKDMNKGLDYPRSRDALELTAEWDKKANEALEQLRQEYKGISIIVRDSVNGNSIPKLAAGLGGGTHLVVSRSFLERMGSSREEFLTCRNVMAGILEQLAEEASGCLGNGAVLGESGVTFWSVPAPEKQAQGSPGLTDRQNPGLEFPDPNEWKRRMSVRSSSYATAAGFGRMANASTKGQVRTVMGEVHRSIASLRLVIALGDDKEKARARAAVGSLQKLLVRGKRKMRKLDEETLLKIRKNRAQKNHELKKYRQMKQEIEKKRRLRSVSDGALRAEGILDEANRKFRFYEDKDREYEAAVPVMPAVAMPSGGAMPAGGEGVFSAGAVVVGAEIAF